MTRFLALPATLVVAACVGAVEPPAPVGEEPMAREPGGGGEDARCRPAPTPIRRLSHLEYEQSLRDLFPGVRLPELALPADPRPHEFDNDAEALGPSPLLLERYAEVAADVAAQVFAAPDAALPCRPASDAEVRSCGESFVRAQGKRIFRRPLSADEVAAYAVLFGEDLPGATFEQRAQLTLELLLTAPEFLYRIETPASAVAPGGEAPLDPYSLATRLSYLLVGTTPDDELLAAADDGRLGTDEGLAEQVDRLLADPRSGDVFRRFHLSWLDVDRLDRVSKMESDGFDDELRASMKEELTRFVDRLHREDGTLRDLLTSPRTEVNARLASVYGVEAPASGWAEVELDPQVRAGVLTRAAFLASHGHPDKPSPVLRGVFVLERLLCTSLGAPPANAEAQARSAADQISGPVTNRELYALMTADSVCQACHVKINPAGFAFEHYDTLGRFRLEEPAGAIDASGSFEGFRFANGVELAHQLAESPEVAACASRKWVRFAFGGGPIERDRCLVSEVAAALEASGGKLRALPRAVALHPRFSTFYAPVSP